jgi:copper chaperone CopZ
MTCGACVVHITRAVKPLAGVDRVKVDLGNELVTVRRDPELVSDDMIAAAIVEAGYQPALAAAQVVTGSDGRGFLERWFGR